MTFRYRRLTKLVREIFLKWQEKTYNFKQFHLLMKYAERQAYKLKKRAALKKMVNSANLLKWSRLMNYRANVFFGRRMFYEFRICVQLEKYHNAKLEQHLFFYTIKKKIFPAWVRYAKLSREVEKKSR